MRVIRGSPDIVGTYGGIRPRAIAEKGYAAGQPSRALARLGATRSNEPTSSGR